jgi:hypothetical protein
MGSLVAGCNKQQPVPKQVEIPKAVESPILPSNLTLTSKDSLKLTVSGIYPYTGNLDTDATKILTDVWLIATHYEKVKSLTLIVSFSGVDRYGKSIVTKVGNFDVKNLAEVRKFVDAIYYCRDMYTSLSLIWFLNMKTSSPYRSRYATP